MSDLKRCLKCGQKGSFQRNLDRCFLLMAHIIFVVKYRRKILGRFGEVIKAIFLDIEGKSSFVIDSMEADQDHIHFLISYPPNLSITSVVRKMKSESTYILWSRYPYQLSKLFWRHHVFWTPSYFASSVGDVDQETIRAYVENQGRK